MMTYFLLIAYLKMSCFYYFLRIYDVIKLIAITYFFLIVYLEMSCFFIILRIRNFKMTYFLLIPYLKMTCLGMFYNIVFINPTIKFITVISPFNKVFIFVFPNNFFYDIYSGSIFAFL